MRNFTSAAVLMALAVTGCGSDGANSNGATSDGTSNSEPATAPSETVEAPSMPTIIPALPPTTPNTPPEPAATAGVERVKAEAGVAKKGRSLDEYEGIVVTPAKTLFAVGERIVFEQQLPKAMQLYKAANGSGPKSHEEFMTQIISANRIDLPELPEGSRYLYDPKTEELMVERQR